MLKLKELLLKLEETKKYFWLLLNLVLIVLVFLGLSAVDALEKYQSSIVPSRVITVAAQDKKAVIPDIASFSFSVVSEGKDPAKIADDNNKIMNRAIGVIKAENVDAKDIQTSGYNLSPRYEYDEKTRATSISGYVLTQTVFVKIRDFSKISKILSSLPALGINQISSLSFEIDNQDKYIAEIRGSAFEKARDKAKEMAAQNHAHLGGVVTFSEYQNYPGPIYRSYDSKNEAFGMGVSAPVAAPSVEPGSHEVTVNVSVTYEIK